MINTVWAGITNTIDRVAYQQQTFISHGSRGQKSEIRSPAWHIASSHGREERESKLSCVYFIRRLILFRRLHPHSLITSQRPHLLILSHWGFEYFNVNFEGAQTSSP